MWKGWSSRNTNETERKDDRDVGTRWRMDLVEQCVVDPGRTKHERETEEEGFEG